MLKKLFFSLVFLLSFLTSACEHHKKDANTIVVGTIAGPETELVEEAKKVALKEFNLNVEIVTFSDYNTPNVALNDGSIDANIFQHTPYLQAQMESHADYQLIAVTKTFLYPMGLYSKKIKSLSELKDDDSVAIPSDPSNGARALLLLEKAGLIRLKPGAGVKASLIDVVANPKQLNIVELEAPQLPRSLSDVSLAAINTTFAIPSGLHPKRDALLLEDLRSPYANIIVTRGDHQKDEKVKKLVTAFQSKAVVDLAEKLFGDAAIPAWKSKR